MFSRLYWHPFWKDPNAVLQARSDLHAWVQAGIQHLEETAWDEDGDVETAGYRETYLYLSLSGTYSIKSDGVTPSVFASLSRVVVVTS